MGTLSVLYREPKSRCMVAPLMARLYRTFLSMPTDI